MDLSHNQPSPPRGLQRWSTIPALPEPCAEPAMRGAVSEDHPPTSPTKTMLMSLAPPFTRQLKERPLLLAALSVAPGVCASTLEVDLTYVASIVPPNRDNRNDFYERLPSTDRGHGSVSSKPWPLPLGRCLQNLSCPEPRLTARRPMAKAVRKNTLSSKHDFIQ